MAKNSMADWSTYTAADGASIEYRHWPSEGPVRAVILLAHGASEHSARYDRVARVLSAEGYEVYAIDHRGHGRTAELHGTFGVARPSGWTAMICDICGLAEQLTAAHPDLPLILLGHSMGSFLAQSVIQRRGDLFAGVVLSGTAGSLEGSDELLPMLTQVEKAEGADQPSAVFAAMFAGFNEPFAAQVEESNGFEWLSRDTDEVAAYLNDPWCGGPLSNGFVTDMVTGMADMWKTQSETLIPATLPVLFIAGEQDPVGANGESVLALAKRYERHGNPVTVHLYPGARHEVFNETNRQDVHADLLNWLKRSVL